MIVEPAVENKFPILVIYGDLACREGAALIAKHFIFNEQMRDDAPPIASMLPFVYIDVDVTSYPDGDSVEILNNEFGFVFKNREDLVCSGFAKLPVVEILDPVAGSLKQWQGVDKEKIAEFIAYLDNNFNYTDSVGSREYAATWWWVQDNADYGHSLFVT